MENDISLTYNFGYLVKRWNKSFIKKELTNLTDVRIITFDYISHKNLLKNNITHEISDDFLDEKDIQLIQN